MIHAWNTIIILKTESIVSFFYKIMEIIFKPNGIGIIIGFGWFIFVIDGCLFTDK